MARTKQQSPFRSFFQAGFECSTHRRRDGRRLDLIAATRHDQFALEDYRALQGFGVKTVRDGIRWHIIEKSPCQYDFSSVLPMLRASQAAGTQVIWDLFHYGWPDDIDVFSTAFVDRLGLLGAAFARFLHDETDEEALVCPLNEPSFLSWAGGEVEYINPFQRSRGFELKQQLVRASIAASEAIWNVLPDARMVHCEPAIHIVPDPLRPQDSGLVEEFRLLQFQSLDMLAGRICPEIGGGAKYCDIIGLNYYWNNQWVHRSRTLLRRDRLYRPFRDLLKEFHERYRCSIFVSETGTEDHRRADWLDYVASEVLAAQERGTPVHGICLYPILNHPGWDNDRHCHCGLLDYADEHGRRECYQPLADSLARWQSRLEDVERFELTASGGY